MAQIMARRIFLQRIYIYQSITLYAYNRGYAILEKITSARPNQG